MEKADAMKWVRALRSGKYEQGKGCLFNEAKNTYCCLGVACKIMPDKFFKRPDHETIDVEKSVLKHSKGKIESLGQSLVWLNDNGHDGVGNPLNFDRIADIIEEHYEEL